MNQREGQQSFPTGRVVQAFRQNVGVYVSTDDGLRKKWVPLATTRLTG